MNDEQMKTVALAIYHMATMEVEGDCPCDPCLGKAALALEEAGVSWLKIAEDYEVINGKTYALDQYMDYLEGEIAFARAKRNA